LAVAAFKQPALKQLTDQQVRFAPPARRAEQLARARKLLEEVEPGRAYPYQFVCFRVTDFRPESHRDLLIPGDELTHDLALFIEALGGTVPAAEPHEELVSLEQLSQRLNVSTKTIRRWRKLGLVGQRVLLAGKRQVCYSQPVIDRFLASNQDRVERGGKFSQLSDTERENILRRAKRLSRVTGTTLTEISRRIARRLGRSAETVRYTIKNHDRENPDQALFPAVTGPLDTTTKESIYSSYRRGIDVETLARKYQKTRTSMYRAINEVRAQRLLEQPLDYIMQRGS
jgi:Mor family transcriptional regulator